MSLATRCTACGTIFRVVQDQLRVSEGWVRCGRCAEVFDARQQLFDMEREAPPPWAASQPMPMAAEPDVPAYSPQHAPAPEPAPEPAPPQASSFGAMPEAAQAAAPAHLAPEAPPPPAPPSTAPVYEAAEPEAPVEATPSTFGSRIEPSFDAHMRAPDPEPDAGPATMLAPEEPDASAGVSEPAPADAAASKRKAKTAKPAKGKKGDSASNAENYVPSFMRHAQGQERWRRPGVLAGLIVATTALGALLAAQAAVHWRDAIAAAYPPSRGTLEALCRVAVCRIEPWRRIDVLSVENSALAQAGAGNQYQLTVSLRNKAGYEVAVPWIDLSLTDPGGAIVARRALSPADFRLGLDGKPVSLAAGAEQSLQVVLNTGSQKVSGYTVEIFNP
ncbi:MAG: zinc-ribbon and DUF3426 domain-containing protein [Paucibacter sp.]|nr:zinc-ribbon and DUF3426 domain-containing protein [Roseateles sp.]